MPIFLDVTHHTSIFLGITHHTLIFLGITELNPHGVPLEEARVFPGRAGKTNPEMANTPI